jgi:hypothetical protein
LEKYCPECGQKNKKVSSGCMGWLVLALVAVIAVLAFTLL